MQQGRKVGLRQASAYIHGDVSRVQIHADNNAQLVMGKFVAQWNLHEKDLEGPAAWPTIDLTKMSLRSQPQGPLLRRVVLTLRPEITS